jgi:hypothetical protein
MLALPSVVAFGLDAVPDRTSAAQIKPGSLSVVCVGAHPDDPESGCGGTPAMYAS